MAKAIEVTFHFRDKLGAPLKGVSIGSITIRETTGPDEESAVLMAKAKGGAATITNELIRSSITAVDGKAVEQPLTAYDTWTTRTRRFISEAWNSVNGIADGELPDFLRSGEARAGSPSTATVVGDSGMNG
jgi:hypothetical protein